MAELQFRQGDGFVKLTAADLGVSVMEGASSSTNGKTGLVPPPLSRHTI